MNVEPQVIRVQPVEGYAIVSLANPPLNVVSLALTLALTRQLYAALRSLERDDTVRALIITGDGDRAFCAWYAEHGESLVADQPSSIGPDAYVAYRPMGTVLAVMPWNFPFWQVLRGAVPVLVGGNGYLLKHAPNVMGCAYLVGIVLLEAGLPEGAFDVINVTNDLVSRVIADHRISAVTVTGSVRAGSAIAAQAGAALKKTVLELGGSDPFIVLADADLEGAVQAALVGRFQNYDVHEFMNVQTVWFNRK